jgi:hypothetical protein
MEHQRRPLHNGSSRGEARSYSAPRLTVQGAAAVTEGKSTTRSRAGTEAEQRQEQGAGGAGRDLADPSTGTSTVLSTREYHYLSQY